MTVLEKPERMRINEAKEKYYPNSFLMINCENMWNDYNFYGEVTAFAPLSKKGLIIELADKLMEEDSDLEWVTVDSKDILDGGSLLGEIYIAK